MTGSIVLTTAGAWPQTLDVTISAGAITLSGQSVSATNSDVITAISFDEANVSTQYFGTGTVGYVNIHVQNGPSPGHEYISDGGWGSGGAARFYGSHTNIGGGAYRGFNTPGYGTPDQLNIRYLQKWNAAWGGNPASNTTGGANNLKGNMFEINSQRFWTQEKTMANVFTGGVTQASFQLAQSYEGTIYRVHGGSTPCNGEGSQETYPQAGCDANSSKWGTTPFRYGARPDEWVCFEYELTRTGRFTIYIWTQDGDFSGEYMEARSIESGDIGVEGISGMYYCDNEAAADSWIMLDELVVATAFIGPPAGFVT
jgi:hypothetical protein